MIIVLIGKSASGKDTIMNYMIDNYGYNRIVTYTTRPPRNGEVNGKDYYFITENEFKNKEFIEQRSYDTVFGRWFYGSAEDATSKEKNNIIILDPDGAAAFKRKFGDEVVVVYVTASDQKREHRARLRGSFDEAEWKRRLYDDAIRFDITNLLSILPRIDIVIDNEDCSLEDIADTIRRNLKNGK